MSAIRILIADDHPIVRDALRTLIDTEAGMKLVGEAVNGVEVVAKAKELMPDVILMDLVMPIKDGIQAIKEIKEFNPTVPILVLTSFSEENRAFPAIRAGALGYLLKDSSPQELLQAIYDVHEGEATIHPSIALQLMREINRSSNLPLAKEPLTARELDVLKLVAQGITNHEIAERLFLSEWTVSAHVRNILAKLHLANRTQAALYALREGIADLDDSKP
jgi:NarL family two-component system response regulator LiaR